MLARDPPALLVGIICLVLKNFLTLGSGEVIARAMQVVGFILLARAVGTEALGQLGLATAVTSYALILVLQGFDTIATRQVSRHPEEVVNFARNIFGLRLGLAAAALLLTCVYAAIFEGAPQSFLFAVLSISYVTNALTPRWIFIALGETKPLAFAACVAQACFLIAVLAIRGPSQLLWAPAGQIIGEIAAAVILWCALPIRAKSILPRVERVFARWLCRESWPISLSLIFGNLLYNFDVFALAAFGRTAEIGLYLACYRLVTAFSPLLGALQLSILPGFSRSYPHFGPIRGEVWRLSTTAVLVLGVTAVTLSLYSRETLALLFGKDFTGGSKILGILIWVLPVQGLRSILRQVLIGFRLQTFDLRNLGFAVATNVFLDVLLIPRFGAPGCAVSTLISETVFCAACVIVIQTKVKAPAL